MSIPLSRLVPFLLSRLLLLSFISIIKLIVIWANIAFLSTVHFLVPVNCWGFVTNFVDAKSGLSKLARAEQEGRILLDRRCGHPFIVRLEHLDWTRETLNRSFFLTVSWQLCLGSARRNIDFQNCKFERQAFQTPHYYALLLELCTLDSCS